jgi:hypothetical protein
MKGLAYNRERTRDFRGAIEAYTAVLLRYPDDRDSKLELARLLASNRQYEAVIKLYRDVVSTDARDVETPEMLARLRPVTQAQRSACSLQRAPQGPAVRN